MEKWTNVDVGPRKIKGITKLISQINWEGKSYTQITNSLRDGEIQEHTAGLTQPMGKAREDVTQKLDEIQERYSGAITLKTFGAIHADLTAVLQWAKDTRPVQDLRKSREELEEAQREFQEREAERQREREEFQAAATEIPEGMTGVYLVKTFNDSDSMSDHYAPHRRHGDRLLTYTTEQTRQTEALARRAVAGIPSLKDVEFEWNTEHWSGGHGNYLMSDPQETVPKDAYNGRKEVALSYEIGFTRGPESMIPHPEQTEQTQEQEQEETEPNEVDVRLNEEKNGVEIHFPKKPDSKILARLKGNGWRWNGRSKCWYRRQSEESIAFAHSLAGGSQ